MTPLEGLLHLRHAWLQEPQRDLMLTVCHACRDALLHDLDRAFVSIEDQHSRCLEDSQVMGFAFVQGTPEQCALHPFLHATEVAGG